MGIARGLITLLLMLSFLGLVAWLMLPRNKNSFDSVARLPLEDEASTPKQPNAKR